MESQPPSAAPRTSPTPAQQHVSSTSSAWNVNAWHWEERPQTLFAKERIPQLLTDLRVDFEGGYCKISRVDTVEGDATINIRKQKKMVRVSFRFLLVGPHGSFLNYELNVTCSWEGEMKVGEDTKKAFGKVRLPYVCEDVEDGQYNIEITCDGSEPHQQALRQKMEGVRPAVLAKLADFVAELASR
ncbi:hypothetical protein PAPYR_2307 [Paratrimastix pyriformis]|uniref:Activator of Hsp90 ATPase AHSA1-like N-terminal domain-containing protein n=1 Tax=Paratrimastix pyriformis TaxID=342808 RepID=A0ABQ8UR14_9EUKA|nr:hypothetical protein PAPYR_2307 [Paratrimastix pyriformis]